MNILYINNFFHIVGGVDRYFFDLADLMEKKGHKVAFFSTESIKNTNSLWRKYFISQIPFSDSSIRSRLKYLVRMFYSRKANRKLKTLITEFKPEIIHVHNLFHQIPATVLNAVKLRRIPIVQTVGDFHLVAPNYNLFHDGKICEITKPDKYYKALLHRCVKGSFWASATEIMEKYYFKLTGFDKKTIDLFIAPSNFMKKKLAEYGIQEEKITVVPHFVKKHIKGKVTKGDGNYILYFGRLSEEKGINILLKVMKKLPQIRLKITGRGLQEGFLKETVKKEKLKNVEFTGFAAGERLHDIISNCRFTVLPSIWHEVFGLSVIESFALGKPVIASRIGGIPEIISDGVNGLLFRPGDGNDLKKKISYFWNDITLIKKLGINARNSVSKKYNSELHYKRILKIYKKLLT